MKPTLKPLIQKTYTTYDQRIKTLGIYDPECLIIEHENASMTNAFALRFSGDKDNGTYVEVGSSHWLENNHTYMLEKEFGWTGVGIDIEAHYVEEYNKNRSNPCIQANAKSFNWDKYFEENNFPKQIDHLSIDIDSGNYLSLLNMPLARYRFTTIAIENIEIINRKPVYGARESIAEEIKSVLLAYNYTFIGSGYIDEFWIDNTYLNLTGNQYDPISAAFWSRDISN
jgi:hypothetical protein